MGVRAIVVCVIASLAVVAVLASWAVPDGVGGVDLFTEAAAVWKGKGSSRTAGRHFFVTLCKCVGMPGGRARSRPNPATALISISALLRASLVNSLVSDGLSQCGWCLLKSPSQRTGVMTTLRKVSDFFFFLPFLFSLYHHPEPSGTLYATPDPSIMTHTPDHSRMTKYDVE